MIEPPVELPVLKSNRLILRPLRQDDLDDIFEYASDEEVTRYLSWETHRSIDDSKQFLKSVLDAYENQMPSNWAIELIDSQKMVGTIGFHNWSRGNEKTEIGYVIGKPYWYQGFMTEAVRTVLSYFFDELCLNRVEAICCVEHFASERVMQKVGMVQEGTMRKAFSIKHIYRDMKMYAILMDEWKQRSSTGLPS